MVAGHGRQELVAKLWPTRALHGRRRLNGGRYVDAVLDDGSSDRFLTSQAP